MKKRDLVIFLSGVLTILVFLSLLTMAVVYKHRDTSLDGLNTNIAKFEYQLGKRYFMRGDLNFKEKNYKAASLDFERSEWVLNKPSLFKDEIQCSSKLNEFIAKIAKEPKNYKNYLERAELTKEYGKGGYCFDYGSSIADYQKVIELKPNLAKAYIGRADALSVSTPVCKFCEKTLDENTLKTYNRIIEDYEKAGELSGYNNTLYEKLGDAYCVKNEYKSALKSYQKIDNLYKSKGFKMIFPRPDKYHSVEYWGVPYGKVEVRIATAKYLDKDYSAAVDEYLKIAGYFEDKDMLARIYNECGKIEYDRKDINASLKYYKKALEYADEKTSRFVYRNKAKVDWKLGYYFNFFQDIVRSF